MSAITPHVRMAAMVGMVLEYAKGWAERARWVGASGISDGSLQLLP